MAVSVTVEMTIPPGVFSVDVYHPPQVSVAMTIPPGVFTANIQAGSSYALSMSVLHYNQVDGSTLHYNTVDNVTAEHYDTVSAVVGVDE